MAATVQGILLTGDHTSRPAAGAPPVGAVYACSDHALLYQTDGAAWTTYATLGTPLDFGEDGDIAASAPGDTAAAGSTGEVADAAHRHAREAMGGTGDMAASGIGDTVAAGATGKVADAGHRHARESGATITAALTYGAAGDIAASAPADTALAGASGKVADAAHRHPREAPLAGGLEVILVAPGPGAYTDLELPFAGSFTGWSVFNDAAGSIVFDVWRDTYAAFPPTVTDTITAADKPRTTGAAKAQGACTGWTTAFAAGDILRINVDSTSGLTRSVLSLRYTRS